MLFSSYGLVYIFQERAAFELLGIDRDQEAVTYSVGSLASTILGRDLRKKSLSCEVDDAVEYFGASRGYWIPTKAGSPKTVGR